MFAQEPPRLAGALRAHQRGGNLLDLPQLVATRPQAAMQARSRRARGGGDCFSWARLVSASSLRRVYVLAARRGPCACTPGRPFVLSRLRRAGRFAGAAAASKDGVATARDNHSKFLRLVADMVGGNVSSEQLHSAAQLIYDVLSARDKSPAEKRAEVVSGVGHVEQESFKAALAIANELREWRETAGGGPEAEGAEAQSPANRESVDRESALQSACKVRKDRAVDWVRDLESLPLYDSEGEADEEEDLLSDAMAAGVGGGEAGQGGDPVEFLEARLIAHCQGLGLPSEAVVEDVFRALSSSQGMDEVQSMLCDLVGFEGLELISDLLQNRTEIAIHVSNQRTERENAEASSKSLAAPAAFGGFR